MGISWPYPSSKNDRFTVKSFSYVRLRIDNFEKSYYKVTPYCNIENPAKVRVEHLLDYFRRAYKIRSLQNNGHQIKEIKER